MRHTQTKPNSKGNVGSGSGAKVTNVTQKSGATKRIQSEAIKSGKKKRRLSGETSAKAKITGVQQRHQRESDLEKTQKKYNPGVVKKSCVNVKRLKKPNEKFKKVEGKADKKTKKGLKRCKGSAEDNEGPPTLCETFSRITTMVAETVINEKENQKLTESIMGKGKPGEGSGSSKGKEGSSGEAKTKKPDVSSSKVKKEAKKAVAGSAKKMKPASPKTKIAKMRSEVKKGKLQGKKTTEKPTLDNTESLVKVLKDEEVSLAFGKGIGTRRKSTAGSIEGEVKLESPESKTKTVNVAKAVKDVTEKKPPVKVAKKKLTAKKDKKSKTETTVKKSVEEGKKPEELPKEQSHKKKVKKEVPKVKTPVKKKELKIVPKKLPPKEAKSPKPKVGSETDGSNSDELTLNIIQKKTKKTKTEPEKLDAGNKTLKQETEDVKVKSEDEKLSSKAKKLKTEKEEKGDAVLDKKILEILKEKKKSKDTESDTEEEMELRRILAKKLGRNMKNIPEVKKKRVETGKSSQESEQRARRLRLFGFWSGPKRHRVASLNALAKVHCLYENESKGVLAEIEKMGQTSEEKKPELKGEKGKKKKSEKESDGEKLDSVVINKRTLRGAPGTRGAGKHWDMFAGDTSTSTSSGSSDESHSDTDRPKERKLPLQPSYRQKLQKKEETEKEESAKAPKRRRNTEIGVTMDLKDMVVRKRMASLNASAILAASYSSEKRSNRKDSSGTSTEDGTSSVDDNDRLSTDEGESPPEKSTRKKSTDREKSPAEKSKEEDSGPPEIEYKHKKHFWKTKVESLKKSSKEKRNSPSPILAEFGLGKDLSTTVLEKEKNDELNDDKEKDKKGSKLGYPPKKDAMLKLKGKSLDGKFKKSKTAGKETEEKDKRKHSKRKLCDEEVKNINIEKMGGGEKTDEYEYKSDSDNGQRKLIELRNTGGSNKKVAVIVNQDTDVTITGVYVNSTRSTHHEGFCSIAGMQYRISSTSHTQTEATAVLKTSTASEQTPPPTEPTNCTSPRSHKSYTPLSALSNMQPPAGAPPHPHLPPPPHHHHHLCGMGQHRPLPDHYIAHGPISHQRPMSPLGRRHGCSSAFSAPHCSSHPVPGGPSSPAVDGPDFGTPLPTHGYFQPAGPLIHHHSSAAAPIKSQNLTSLDSTATSESQTPASNSEEAAESTTSRSADNPAPAPPPPPPATAHHMGYPRAYPPYQGGYYQGSYYPPPPQTAHYQPPPPPPSFHQHYHHHQDLCYPPGYPPSSYPPPPGAYRRFLQPPPSYYSPELTYGSSGPPPPQDPGAQQMVVPGGPSSSYSAPLDPYPPPAPYYPGYSPGPGPACYSHPPSSRNLAFIEQTYQSCPCPMQLCPKNVHIGPLTGECKRPGALPLPPVALQLPQEPPGAAGPPSPARGSAGMPPQPSPVSSTARPNCGPAGWDGRPASKTSTEIKWEESKTALELKPPKYKTETYNSKDIWDLSSKKTITRLEESENPAESQWKDDGGKTVETDAFAQGLLAISSKDANPPIQDKEPAELADEGTKIKSETVTPPMEVSPDKTELVSRKRNSSGEESEQSPKRKKSEEDGTKRRKRKSESENSENKVKKVKKCGSVKEEEKVFGGTKKKGKLLKDRNETVEREEEAMKILGRRKSNQERSGVYPEAETVRKSKSCSPARSKARDTSPGKETRKPEGGKTGKSRADARTREHSKAAGGKSGRRKGNGTLLGRCPQAPKPKKKAEGGAPPLVVVKKSRKALSASPRSGLAPKWSNGWSWDSESFDAKVYLTNDEPPVMRKCYSAMRHVEGDVIHPKDCILLKAGPRKIDLPFVAKVAALWENPEDGEMMVSLLWYYRPEHTDQGRQASDQQDEIFASRHKDINSVACIEDKCFVLTYNEYCRYRKKVRRVEEGMADKSPPVPRLEQPYFRVQRQPPCVMAPDMVFFCRRVYDFRQKRLLKNPT